MNCKNVWKWHTSIFAVVLVAGSASGKVAAAQTESVLYSFQGSSDGSAPWSVLVADETGNLYGTTVQGGYYGYGTVFELTPPHGASSAWTETVLYSFQGGNDGALPYSGLVFDEAGNLYGTTSGGGNEQACFECGTVFRLAPPATAGGSWTETVLYTFGVTTTDAAIPYAGLIIDDDGNLFGTTRAGGDSFEGTVFELSAPDDPGGNWHERILYSFTGGNDGGLPQGGVVRKSGALYGTTIAGGAFGYGTVFQLTRPGGHGPWSENVLYSFTGGVDGGEPFGTPVFDRSGRLFGTTATAGNAGCGGIGCGTVFQLSPASAGWSASTLYSFTGNSDGGSPLSTLIIDRSGALFGTAAIGGNMNQNCNALSNQCGTVFELKPSSGGWVETTLHSFNGTPDGYYPVAGLLFHQGSLYGTASSGGDAVGDGVVFQIKP